MTHTQNKKPSLFFDPNNLCVWEAEVVSVLKYDIGKTHFEDLPSCQDYRIHFFQPPPIHPLDTVDIFENSFLPSATKPLAKKKFIPQLYKKFRKQKISPQKTLDLHGNTFEQAYQKTVQFIAHSHATRQQCILIITGKGKHSHTHHTLQKQLKTWLDLSSLSPYIHAYDYAPPHLGGKGCFYILLSQKSIH